MGQGLNFMLLNNAQEPTGQVMPDPGTMRSLRDASEAQQSLVQESIKQTELQQQILKAIQDQIQQLEEIKWYSQKTVEKTTNIELRSSVAGGVVQEDRRHLHEFLVGQNWSVPDQTWTRIAQWINHRIWASKNARILRTSDLCSPDCCTQGQMPMECDFRRGRSQVLEGYLQSAGKLQANTDQEAKWDQGLPMLWLPESQERLMKEGVPEWFFQPYQSDELDQLLKDARPINHKNNQPYTQEQWQAVVAEFDPRRYQAKLDQTHQLDEAMGDQAATDQAYTNSYELHANG